MKKELIAGIIASLFVGQVGQVPEAELVDNKANQIIESQMTKAKTTSLVEFEDMREMLSKGPGIYLIEKEAEKARLQAEEKARQIAEQKAEAERIAEEARKAEEERLELERQSSVGFDDMDVTRLSNMFPYELENVLYNTTGGEGLAPYASYFIEAEEIYGINAFFICAIAAQESGWGRNAAGNGTNLTGYAVYNSYSEGASFEGGIRHNILETARLLAEDYVDPNGPYHSEWEGYNYGKSIYEINVRYCLLDDMETTDYDWSANIGKIASNLASKYHELR